jgi:hypothetical protein
MEGSDGFRHSTVHPQLDAPQGNFLLIGIKNVIPSSKFLPKTSEIYSGVFSAGRAAIEARATRHV